MQTRPFKALSTPLTRFLPILLLLLFFRPQGLFGKAESERV